MSGRIFYVNSGGGCGLLRYFAVLGVCCLMLAISLVPGISGSDAIVATSGSGTEDDPYSGTITDKSDQGGEFYAYIGTIIDFDFSGRTPFNGGASVDPESGLNASAGTSYITVYGTLEKEGTFIVYVMQDVLGEIKTYTYLTIHVVPEPSYPELVFMSDPIVDGTITYAD